VALFEGRFCFGESTNKHQRNSTPVLHEQQRVNNFQATKQQKNSHTAAALAFFVCAAGVLIQFRVHFDHLALGNKTWNRQGVPRLDLGGFSHTLGRVSLHVGVALNDLYNHGVRELDANDAALERDQLKLHPLFEVLRRFFANQLRCSDLFKRPETKRTNI
jgi:hypothetical protein